MILAAFILSALYWLYLIMASQFIVVHDAEGYELLGRLLHTQGWIEYFKSGPNREPLYPFLISISLRISDWTGLGWDSIQKIIQCVFLLTTQALFCMTAKRMKIKESMIAAFILYMGFSPALVNATFSLFSEVASFPWPLAIVLLSAVAWHRMSSLKRAELIILGLLMAAAFIGLTLVKGIFEPIALIYMSLFWGRLLWAWFKKKQALFANILVFVLTFSATYYSVIFSYELGNKIHNGQFVLTDRGSWTFYGNAAWRVGDSPPGKIPAYLATIPGQEFCQRVFPVADCEYWNTQTEDKIWENKMAELNHQGLTPAQVNHQMFQLGVQEIFHRPLTYIFFMAGEASKIFFWESTHIGFVAYPQWLENVFNAGLMTKGVVLFIGILMIGALILVARRIWPSLRKMFEPGKCSEEHLILLFTLWMMLVFICFMSMFFILKRYLFPVAPMSFVLMVYGVNEIYKKVVK